MNYAYVRVSPAKYKLTGKENYIRRQLKKGRSKRSLAIELKVKWSTLNSLIIREKIV